MEQHTKEGKQAVTVYKRKLAKISRWLHIYLSMVSFTIVLFFSVTGLTLNHADYFQGQTKTRQQKGKLPVEWVNVADTTLPFQLHFHSLEKEGVLVETPKFRVDCFATQHRIPCWGFIIREKRKPRKIDKEKVVQYEIPAAYYERLKEGADYETKDGQLIRNEWVTLPNKKPRSYAFCADTRFDESICDKVKDSTLLYHEATYLKDLTERAAARFHSTTEQAATIAQKAGVQRLLIGHFSSKYEKLDEFRQEAQAVFADTELAIEGVTYRIGGDVNRQS